MQAQGTTPAFAVAVVANDPGLELDGVEADREELHGPEAAPVGVDDRMCGGEEEREERVGRQERITPTVAMADLSEEPEGEGVDLDRAADIPGGEEAVPPREHGGVPHVGGTER